MRCPRTPHCDVRKGLDAGRAARTFINESGICSLVLRSRKPEAKAFEKWVTSVLLPAPD